MTEEEVNKHLESLAKKGLIVIDPETGNVSLPQELYEVMFGGN